MLTSKVTEQGQTTVPPEIRKALNAPPGTVLSWVIHGSAAEVASLENAVAGKRGHCDYDACLKSLQESPAVADGALIIRRSKES
jgi:bifunctional DNA-binding transcriptional regulator/antitoxin component of YhaV-PrlF toxin-antitoxin module